MYNRTTTQLTTTTTRLLTSHYHRQIVFKKLIRGYASKPPIRPTEKPLPPRRGIDLTKLDTVKERFQQWNKETPHKRKIAAGLIALYIITAAAGIQYLRDTKHKATGEESPYQNPYDDDVKGIPSPRDTTEIYEQMAREYDGKIRWEEFLALIGRKRKRVMKNVTGDALEVSCGTGRNIPYFNSDQVDSITFLDSSKAMLEVAKEKFDKKYNDFDRVQFVKGRAEDLEELVSKSGQKFDTVYETFGLCSHEDPDKSLKQFASLLKPDGKIVLLEHGRSDKDSLNERMDSRAETRAQEWGCRWNLDIHNYIEKSGLEIVEQERWHFGTTYFYILKKKK